MGRPPRADAVRNRARILAAAREQITRHGPEAAMDAIAAEAGVAVGTLYRHFPTKEALVAAVIDEFLDRVVEEAEAAATRAAHGAPAGEELTVLLRDLVEESVANQAVKAAAASLGAAKSTSASEARVSSAIAVLIAAGQRDGTIPADVTIEDVYLLVTTAPYGQSAAARGRWLDLMLTGLLAAKG